MTITGEYQEAARLSDYARVSLLMVAWACLLKGKASIEGERQEARSHQDLLKRSVNKGRAGQSLLHCLYFDQSEVINPQMSTWSQYTIQISEGLLQLIPMMHADGRHNQVKGVI